ncbi:MAG TPA: EAL domain-containing protein [Thermoanaerobaculia bacterium]|nr:EAL domain-containing protein [Thermoanaerobaculia bacterium]
MTIPSNDSLPPAGLRSRVQRARRLLARLMQKGGGQTAVESRTAMAILRAQQDATLDGILVVDNSGRILSYNRRFLEIWGIPDHIAARADDNALLGYAADAVADWDAFIELVNYLYEHPAEVRTDDPVPLKDGRILSRASTPLVVGTEVRGRVWYFRDVTNSVKAERLQAALFRIAQLSREAEDLQSLYRAVHAVVGELMNARNFYIATLRGDRDLDFPYFIDELDPTPPATAGRGLTAYVIRTGTPLLATAASFDRLVAGGEVEAIGAASVDWLGAPLQTGDTTWGALVTQSYDESSRYTEKDLEVLVFVAQHVASAVEQKRKDDALRESESRYRQMFHNTRAVQLLIDPENGTIVDANAAACDYYGYTRDELRAMRIWDINVRGEDAVRTDLSRASTQETSLFHFRHMLASGELRDVEVHSGPVDAAGGRRYLYSIVHDVTERRRAEQALQQSEAKYRVIFDYAPVGIYQSTRDGTIVTANAALARILGYDSVEDLLTRNLERDIYASPAQREELIRRFEPFGYANHVELQWLRKDGTPIWVQLNAHAIRSPHGTPYFEGFVFDVTERKRAEDTVTAANAQLLKHSAAMTASMDGIGIINERLEFTYANDSLARLFGYAAPEAMIGRSLCDLYEPHEQVRLITSIVPLVQERGRWRGEATGLRADGTNFPQEISLSTIAGDGSTVCVVRDITERTYAEEQIKHLAYHDALTNLPNRLLFKDRLSVALSHAHRDGTSVAVLFLDLDRFKVINDSLGHNIGDQLLQAVATRVAACVRESDTVARLGGDEFTVLLPRLQRSQDVAPIANKIIEAVRHPFHIEGREFYITTSIGISVYPEDGADAETLIKNADTAMYQAKELGRDNYQLFNAHVNAKALQRIAIEHGLRRALANDELHMHYQPIQDLRTGRITGMEALLRWNHPEMGKIPPATFIPIAESTGGMIAIGAWALRQSCRQAKEWHDAGHRTLTLAVNLSVTQLQQTDLVDTVRSVLDDTGFPARLLELEITESGAMHSPETSIRVLYELKKLGVRISLDDFGTGHSSLSYLKRFPVDTLKIDQSFVQDTTSDPDAASIVLAIIAMAHSLRLKVLAEGVEYTDQANFLRHNGCDLLQGYLITPPVAAEEFIRIVSLVGE